MECAKDDINKAQQVEINMPHRFNTRNQYVGSILGTPLHWFESTAEQQFLISTIVTIFNNYANFSGLSSINHYVVVARDERETETGRDESGAEDETRAEQKTRREQSRGRDENRAEDETRAEQKRPQQ